MSKDAEREKRLAEALREKFKRRKAQARDAAGPEPVAHQAHLADSDQD